MSAGRGGRPGRVQEPQGPGGLRRPLPSPGLVRKAPAKVGPLVALGQCTPVASPVNDRSERRPVQSRRTGEVWPMEPRASRPACRALGADRATSTRALAMGRVANYRDDLAWTL